MKLLFCPRCQDVFKLSYEVRICECGMVKGRYIDNTMAETNGAGISLAIGNGALMDAIYAMEKWQSVTHDKAERSTYYKPGQGLISHAWIRPNEGPGNPHCKVNKDLA